MVAFRRCLLTLLTCCWLTATAHAEGQGQEPADGAGLLQDDARLLKPEMLEGMRLRQQTLWEETGVAFYFVTFPTLEDDPAPRAQALLDGWSQGRPAVLMVWAWGRQVPLILASDAIWKRYPVDDMVLMLSRLARDFLTSQGTLAEKLELTSRSLADGIRLLEKEQRRREKGFLGDRSMLFFATGALLAGALLWVLLAATRWKSRRHESYFFPDVEVGIRLGAPFGGGLIGQTETPAAGTDQPSSSGGGRS